MDKRYLKATTAALGVFTGALMIAAMSPTPAQAWTDNSLPNTTGCRDGALQYFLAPPLDRVFVNDAGTVAGTCRLVLASGGQGHFGFVQLASARAPTQLAALTSTVGGAPCHVSGLNNAAAGSETIIGYCADGNSVEQGVFWKASTPTNPPTLLQPLSVLGLAPDVQTQAIAVNAAGLITGVSISSSGAKTPVIWSSTGVASQLAGSVGFSNTNCVPTDINDASTPTVVGNCPALNPGQNSRVQAIQWKHTSDIYLALPVPTPRYQYCEAAKINLSGQILGSCWIDGGHRNLALWGPGGTGPTMQIATIGDPGIYTKPIALSDNGVILCSYIGGNQPCLWYPTLSDRATEILFQEQNATNEAWPVGIGNNGKVVGYFKKVVQEIAIGQKVVEYRAFHVQPLQQGVNIEAVDDGPGIAGGPTAIVTGMSKSGVYEGAAAGDPIKRLYRALSQQVPNTVFVPDE